MDVSAEEAAAAAAAAAAAPPPPSSSSTRAPFDFRRPWTPPPRARTPKQEQPGTSHQQHAEAGSSSVAEAAAAVASTSAMAIDATSAASAGNQPSSSTRPRRIPGDTAASIVLIGFRGVGVAELARQP